MLCNILLGAVFLDISSRKITNQFIILSLAIGCNWQIITNGLEGMIEIILVMGITMLLLYPIYLLKGLGAGDVKLFCVIGCFLAREELIKSIIVSLVIGAIMGIFILTKNKRWVPLLLEVKEGRNITRTEIHFSIPILISTLIQIGGYY